MALRRVYSEVTMDMDYEPTIEELKGYLSPAVIQAVKDVEPEMLLYGYSYGDIWGYMLPEERRKNVEIWFNRWGIANVMSNPPYGKIVEVTEECVKLSNGLCFRPLRFYVNGNK